MRLKRVVTSRKRLRVVGNGPGHLSPAHLRLLKDSALSTEAIDTQDYHGTWRYETLDGDDGSLRLHTLGFSDAICARVPGLLVRLFNRDGEIWGCQYRPDHPRLDLRTNTPIKYETPPGQSAQIDIPPLSLEKLGDRKVPIIITEGARKADAACSAGYVAVSLIGVGIWRVPGFSSFTLSGRDVFIAFDSDAVTKREVQTQERKLALALGALGAEVKICRLYAPDGMDVDTKVGLDDFLSARGDIEGLLSDAVSIGELIEYQELTDIGNSKRFVAIYADEIRYCDIYKSWLIWNGRFWEKDVTLQIQERAKDAIRIMEAECASFPGSDEDRKKRFNWYIRSENGTRIREMMNLAKSDPSVQAHPLDFDVDPYLLCVENGTLDLQSGVLREHRPADMITKMAPVEFVEKATDDDWEELLDFFVRPNDENGDTEALLQRLAFASLTGVSEKAFAELYDEGNGDTGKTTFVQSLLTVLGEYAEVIRVDAFMNKRFGGNNNSEIAACFGKRLVVSSEVPPNARLDSALMKKLTEGGKAQFQYRQLYYKAFTGPVTFTIIMDGNVVPKANAEDTPLFGRWRAIPFLNKLPKTVDKNVRWFEFADGASYRSAVLWWALQGRERWLAEGIGTSASVERAIVEIRRDMDPLSGFWESDKIQFGDVDAFGAKLFATTAQLYDAYKVWHMENLRPVNEIISERNFVALLKAKPVVNGLRKRSGVVVRGWHGIGLS